MLKKLIVLTAAAICAATAFAEGFMPSFSASATWHAKDMSKGLIMMNKSFIDYNVGVSLMGFTASADFKQDLTAYHNPGHNGDYTRNRRNRIFEIDYLLDYSKTFDFGWVSPITLGASFEYDQYPAQHSNGQNHDSLWYLNAALDNVLAKDGNASLGFATSLLYDDDEGEHAFRGEVSAKFGYKLNDKINVGANLVAYWRSGKSNGLVYYNDDYNYVCIAGESFNTIMLKPTISYAITENLSVNAYAAIATALNEKARKNQENGPMNSTFNFDAGFGVAYNF